MSHYWAAVAMAPAAMRQLLARAIGRVLLTALAAVGITTAIHMDAHQVWYGALIVLAMGAGALYCLWDTWDCLRIRRDLRRKLEA